ncbi:MAG: hypothetical protein A2W05_05070 [Candidatus Schekmanbacteria bacterium RBG_16_38_10]|uniref:Roadblock/LAMTOR2 domain-containing protein n=1 Tax=Candidatus Schekmanbacteria bacterium RBG_16_38_10 TaxID=1817879 RepID=A0A1F7RNK4_9BACT|nr:MAG: hypothetical protein A2W05_05070 [Candidatus Schekmanbacteria bacterium RBG_16_38_10]
MKEILQDLNKEVGIKGSLILTKDGIIVVSALGYMLREDTVAAVASISIKSVNTALKSIKMDNCTKLIFNAEFGKIVFVECGNAYIAVVLDKHINIDLTMLSIMSTAHTIKNMGNISI